jgi:signal transduction histidine kinase
LASHQLRTPLTSIRFFAELLRDSTEAKLGKRQENYLNKILFSTDKMIDLVTDLLNVSRLDLGQLRINPKPTSLNGLIGSRIEEIMPVAVNTGVKIIFHTEIPDDEEVPVDRNLLAQVIHNLLSNALRYSPKQKGKVIVSLSKGQRYYSIAVADNGIGIPKKDANKIFERFYRAENAISMESEGSGLGLYLVKVIMEACGGKVILKSPTQNGATFIVHIPRAGMKPVVPALSGI